MNHTLPEHKKDINVIFTLSVRGISFTQRMNGWIVTYDLGWFTALPM